MTLNHLVITAKAVQCHWIFNRLDLKVKVLSMHYFHFIKENQSSKRTCRRFLLQVSEHSLSGLFWHMMFWQMSWRNLTPWAKGDMLYIQYKFTSHLSLNHTFAGISCQPSRAVTDISLRVFQTFNKDTHKHKEAPEKVLTLCVTCVSNLITATF